MFYHQSLWCAPDLMNKIQLEHLFWRQFNRGLQVLIKATIVVVE